MKVKLTKSSLKDLQKIPKSKRRKIETILRSITNPSVGKPLKGEFSDSYSIRVWPYRIIYQVYKQMIVVKAIKHRQSAYK